MATELRRPKLVIRKSRAYGWWTWDTCQGLHGSGFTWEHALERGLAACEAIRKEQERGE